MSIRSPRLPLVPGFVCAAAFLLAPAAAQPVLSMGKQYAYYLTVPGQPPNHYMDDGATTGPHVVHSSGLGVFGVGGLTDGVVAPGNVTGPNTQLVAMWQPCCGNAPPADIIIDLGTVQIASELGVGTIIGAALNNNAPDDVTVSFSVTGTNAADFKFAQYYNLEGLYGPLADGHHELRVKIGTLMPARYVKFSFDGGSMKEPNGSDPDEKWLLDELYVYGISSTCNASAVVFGNGLAGTSGVPTLGVSAPPRFSTTINLSVSNSSGAASSTLIMAGVRETGVPILGGFLFVDPLVQVVLPLPAAGLSLPVRLPGPPCSLPICLQALQLDAGAVNGVSMTPGLRLQLGT